MSRLRTSSALVAVGVVAAWACESRTPPAVTVTDSGGVTITTAADARRTFALVDPRPLLEIGGAEEVGATQFSQVPAVWMDGDGRLWVVDGQSGELRIFEPDGTHLRTVGGRGQGPGEFLQPQLLGGSAGGEIAVWDPGNARLTVLDGRGDPARTIALETGERAPPRSYAAFQDGSLLVQFPRLVEPPPPGALLLDTTRLERMELPSGSSRPQGEVAGPSWIWTGSRQVPVPFTANPGLALEGSLVHLASGPDFRVVAMENGAVREIYGVDRPPRPVEERHTDAYAETVERLYPGEDAIEFLEALDHPARPASLPAYSALILADDGRIWARVFSVDPTGMGEWDIYGDDRSWLGRVETPVGLRVTQVVQGRVVGVWYDNLGVEYVRIHEFRERETS